MQVESNILKMDDIIKLSAIMSENGYSNNGLTVIIPVRTQGLLNKINEDFYYRNATEGDKKSHPESVDEIVVNINGITFKYILENGTE